MLSFLSGTADDMSLVLQMEAQQKLAAQGALSQSQEMLEGLAKAGNRNERKIGQSASEDMGAGGKEELKHKAQHQQLMGEFDDALQY